jgi:glycosyltransferase involved in cell wall biosynthesis
MRVLRIFHAGRNPSHRARDRALLAAGVDVIYVVPRHWPEAGSEPVLSLEPFPIIEVDVQKPGDVNRHSYTDIEAVAHLAFRYEVDLVDLFEEPFSRAAGQLLPRLPPGLPVVMYSAQNLDKRWPPPFRTYERNSFRRVRAFYPCSRQAASVLRGKGFGGLVEPLPLGYDEDQYIRGQQTLSAGRFQLALVGRMVREKGVSDAVQILAELRFRRGMDVRLVLAGSGPALAEAMRLARQVGVAQHVEHLPWLDSGELAALYRDTHVVLSPSRSTATWAEQYGRMVVEAQASGCVVVGYNSGSLLEVGGTAARLVREGDVSALAEAVALSLNDEKEFQARRLRGQALVADRTWSSVARRQAQLYRAAMRQPSLPLLEESQRQLREAARAEFGPPAEALGQTRPFAMPILRRPNLATKALGGAIDLLAEARHKSL